MLLLPPAARSATALSARCCYRRGTTALSALGEGVVPFSSETTPLSAAMEPAAFFALSALAAVALAFVLANYFEPNPNAREALFGGGDGAGVGNVGARRLYVVKWFSPKAMVYESLGSVAATMVEGEANSLSVESLEEAGYLARLLERQVPRLRYSILKLRYDDSQSVAPASVLTVRSFDASSDEAREGGVADDEKWVGDYSEEVSQALGKRAERARESTAPQRIWDELQQAEAEREAAAARSSVDAEWARYKRETLELGRKVRETFDVSIIGGESGAAPCRLCNGKGFRVLFKERQECDWCGGAGVEQ